MTAMTRTPRSSTLRRKSHCQALGRTPAASLTSVQQTRKATPRSDHPRILRTGDLEVLKEPGAHEVLGGGVESREQVEQSAEGVLEVATGHIKIRDGKLGIHVGGLVGGGRTDIRGR